MKNVANLLVSVLVLLFGSASSSHPIFSNSAQNSFAEILVKAVEFQNVAKATSSHPDVDHAVFLFLWTDGKPVGWSRCPIKSAEVSTGGPVFIGTHYTGMGHLPETHPLLVCFYSKGYFVHGIEAEWYNFND